MPPTCVLAGRGIAEFLCGLYQLPDKTEGPKEPPSGTDFCSQSVVCNTCWCGYQGNRRRYDLRPLPSARKRVGFYDWEGTNTVRFQRAAAGMQSPHMQAETTILSIYYLSNIFDRNRYCSVRIIYKFYVFRIIKKIRGYCYFNSCISFNFMLFAFSNGIGSFDGNRYRDTLLMDLLYKFFGKFIRFRKNHMAQFNCI